MRACPQEVQQAISQAVADGMKYRDAALKFSVSLRTVGRYACDYQRRKKQPKIHGLTGLQQEVVVLVAHGLSNTQIAEQLHIHEHTVRNQIHVSLSTLHLVRRSQLVIFAHQKRLVNLDEVVLPGGQDEQHE